MGLYRRNLPHLIIPGYPFFITTRLAGSVPSEKLVELKKEKENELRNINFESKEKERRRAKQELQRKLFLKYDSFLDSGKYGPQWLRNVEIANIICNSLLWGDGKRYHLFAFTIMPNHIHIVLLPIFRDETEKDNSEPKNRDDYFLARIMESFKKYTAREANKVLKRKGQFWQHESYDHLLRNDVELQRAVKFTLNNPVYAGLVARPEDYRWNYVNWDYL